MICKECLMDKQLIHFYKHPKTKSGYLGRCKECILKWRKTEKELSMARIRDKKRWKQPRRWLYTCRRWINNRVTTGWNWRYLQHWIKNLWNSFEEFYVDMLDSFILHSDIYWIDNTTIERINNLWNYCRDNCKWATYKEQCNNISTNHIVNYKWKLYTISQLAELLWINYKYLWQKLKQNNRDTSILF